MLHTQSHSLGVCVSLFLAAVAPCATGQIYDGEEQTLYCFQCNSGLDIDCTNLQQNDTHSFHYKPCLDSEKYNGSMPFCRKIVQRIFPRKNMERVIRKCGWVRHPRLDCYNYRNEDHQETICQCFTPGCNRSSSLQHSVTLLVLVLLLHILYATRTK